MRLFGHVRTTFANVLLGAEEVGSSGGSIKGMRTWVWIPAPHKRWPRMPVGMEADRSTEATASLPQDSVHTPHTYTHAPNAHVPHTGTYTNEQAHIPNTYIHTRVCMHHTYIHLHHTHIK